jgi:hypothetical protein
MLMDRSAVNDALKRIDDRFLGEDILSEVRELVKDDNKEKKGRWKDPAMAIKYVALAQALYAARRVKRAEYVYYASWPVENIHESRWMDGEYDKKLSPINDLMKAIESKHGLNKNEYWPVGTAPPEHERLNKKYELILDSYRTDVMREFGLADLADLLSHDRSEYERLRERGRRAIHHHNDTQAALKDVVVRYEEDARRAASAGAYSAAITLLGAGLEGLLLLRCLKSKNKSAKTASTLPKKQRPRNLDDPTGWTFETLIETNLAAGWLPNVSTAIATYDPAGLAHILRVMRNQVHPGRCVREYPWLEISEDDYKDGEAIYVALLSKIIRK